MDWIIGIVVPEETIFHNGRMLNTIILAVMLLALLAIYFFCRRTIKDTTTPSRPSGCHRQGDMRKQRGLYVRHHVRGRA